MNTLQSIKMPIKAHSLKNHMPKNHAFHITPSTNIPFEKFYLTQNKSAWITITWLSDELKTYIDNTYSVMFNLHPNQRGKVVMFGEDVNSPRWHRSYLKTPVRDPEANRSYMYSGKEAYKDLSLPQQFQPILDFLNKGETGDLYNQVIANWYANGNDFIAAHSDCQVGMKPNAGIAIVTLSEKQDQNRTLRFTPKRNKISKNDPIFNKVEIPLIHGSIITMHGDLQDKFNHRIPKAIGFDSSRISLTFRKF